VPHGRLLDVGGDDEHFVGDVAQGASEGVDAGRKDAVVVRDEDFHASEYN
jgi:hypothetical protein